MSLEAVQYVRLSRIHEFRLAVLTMTLYIDAHGQSYVEETVEVLLVESWPEHRVTVH